MTLQLNNVSKSYGKNNALVEISHTFEKGRIYGLLGPNGSGKTSMLKLMTGLIFSEEGSVTLNGIEVTRKSTEKIAYMTELDMFYEAFTVRETIEFLNSQFSSFSKEKAFQLVEELRLDPAQKVKALSKGNRVRLKLATTLARSSEAILLDEPFSGLDSMVRDSIVESLLKYIDFDNQILIIATHEISEMEPLLDEAVIIFNGRIIGHEIVEELREKQGISVLQWFKQIAGEHGEVLQ